MNLNFHDHPSFKYIVKSCFLTNSNNYKIYLGSFVNKRKWQIRFQMEKKVVDENIILSMTFIRNDSLSDIASDIIYQYDWSVPYNYDYILNNINKEINRLMKIMDDVNECQHCGKYIFIESSFDDKCFSCGLQNIYDEINSEHICPICLQSIGFGKTKKCKNKHHMHPFCYIKYCNYQTNKNICPFKCGSVIE